MKKFSFVLILLFACTAYGQNSGSAKKLLDKVSNTIKSKKDIAIDFSYELHNTEENIRQKNSGKLKLQGNKYRLDYLGMTQIYDGKKVYSIVPDNEEVVIEDKNDEENNTISPEKLLYFYKDGYNYKMDITQKVNGKNIQYIKLMPRDSKTEIKSILLGIDTKTNWIYKLIETGSDNTKTTITVNSFQTTKVLSKSLFIFDAKKYPDFLITTN
ncbi:MAG: outer membrane lipoprotein carrier protein LolA [Flavobacteriaceae bacterium]|nr:outer membrane lipoprotein carrier protein LolA [Flavobacteriaceae bacterium]